MAHPDNKIGVVVIGRNEGERLIACLTSLLKDSRAIVYVDSGSTDNSVTEAQKLGVEVVNLDLQQPFTAARARNAGFARLNALYPDLQYVQFVDGDCELFPNWLAEAFAFLESNNPVAIACGRRRERYPDQSIYNYQCDIEWNTPVGETKACGGDFLARKTAFAAVEGFRDSLIAGEEPELCLRLRKQGFKIWRLDADMTWHDAAILRFGQWWRRSVRTGYAFAEGAYLHGGRPERHWVAEAKRATIWGIILPEFIVLFLGLEPLFSLLLFMLYPLQWLRLSYKYRDNLKNYSYALLMVLSKFAEGWGIIKFVVNLVLNRSGRLIEYK
jgi:glycosyltransferase involved in cell wall biosynthesis